MSDDLTTQERIMLYDAHKERDELRARLTDSERQLREAQERCERLEGAARRLIQSVDAAWEAGNLGGHDYPEALECLRAVLSEPDEMTQAMQEGRV